MAGRPGWEGLHVWWLVGTEETGARGIVFNMTVKPATAGAIGAMGVALALGAAVAAVRWIGSRQAQSDGIAVA